MALKYQSDASLRLRAALPVWKILLTCLIAAFVGAGSYLWYTGANEPAAVTTTTATTTRPAAAPLPTSSLPPINGLTSRDPSAPAEPVPGSVTTTETQTVTTASWKTNAGRWTVNLGLAFLAALIVGVAFRVFLKVAITLGIVLVLLIALTGYWGYLTPDRSEAARAKVAQAVDKVEDASAKLKDAALASIPTFAAAAVGFVVGFARR